MDAQARKRFALPWNISADLSSLRAVFSPAATTTGTTATQHAKPTTAQTTTPSQVTTHAVQHTPSLTGTTTVGRPMTTLDAHTTITTPSHTTTLSHTTTFSHTIITTFTTPATTTHAHTTTTIPTVAAISTASTSLPTTTASSSASDGGLAPGILAGAIIVPILVVLMGVVAGFIIIRRRRQRRRPYSLDGLVGAEKGEGRSSKAPLVKNASPRGSGELNARQHLSEPYVTDDISSFDPSFLPPFVNSSKGGQSEKERLQRNPESAPNLYTFETPIFSTMAWTRDPSARRVSSGQPTIHKVSPSAYSLFGHISAEPQSSAVHGYNPISIIPGYDRRDQGADSAVSPLPDSASDVSSLHASTIAELARRATDGISPLTPFPRQNTRQYDRSAKDSK